MSWLKWALGARRVGRATQLVFFGNDRLGRAGPARRRIQLLRLDGIGYHRQPAPRRHLRRRRRLERARRLVVCAILAHLLHRRGTPARPATRVVHRPRCLRFFQRSPSGRRARRGGCALRAGSGKRWSTRVLQSAAGGGRRLRSEPIQLAGRSMGPARRRRDRGQSGRSRRRPSDRPDRRQCQRSLRLRRRRLGVGRRNLDGNTG